MSLLSVVSGYTEAAVEPLAGLAIDRASRRQLLVAGAAGVALASLLAGLAPTYIVLLAALALAGAASPLLRMTSDIVLIEAGGARGAVGRAAALGLVGSLVAPLGTALALRAGLDWRTVLTIVACLVAIYACALAMTSFARPRPGMGAVRGGLWPSVRADLLDVLRDRHAFRWLVFLRVFYVMETAAIFEPLWLTDVVGMSQATVAAYVAFEMGAAALGATLLGRLERTPSARVLVVATASMLCLFPLWFLVPGVGARFIVGVPLAFAWSLIWPIARVESLRGSARPGAVTAVNSLTGLAFLPLPLALGWAAEHVGLTVAMLVTREVGTAALFAMALRYVPQWTAEQTVSGA